MFSGIVDHCGQIKEIVQSDKSFRITISSEFSDLNLGESIAIDGACLTVTSINGKNFTVELSPETRNLTIARYYKEEVAVNLERSLRLIDRLGGHFVTGHVDGTCRIKLIQKHDDFMEIHFDSFPAKFNSYLVKKGSIAINGVSLTLNEIEENSFKVMLIPHTLQVSNLSTLTVGDPVNIEFDYLAKLVINQTSPDISSPAVLAD
jgi:riboflavin synthase